ncbi:5413_t:CDS:1, partial [Funneliformis mosseae]
CFATYGLSFSNDLRLQLDGCWRNTVGSYPNVGIPSNFNVSDYE